MRSGLSSKHPKKKADEERSKKKKMKSNKRRRHDSLSSSSYSSDSEIAARSRRKSGRREPKKPEKKRKEPKKLVSKKNRKISYRGDSSASSPSSYSSRSCSTCRGRSSSSGRSESNSGNSRSPPSLANRRPKLRERSRSRSPLVRPSRKAKLWGRSRSRSPFDRAVRRVKSRERSRSKGRGRGRSRRSSQKRSYERLESSRSQSSRSYGRSQSYSEGRDKEVDPPRRLKSALVVTKESVGMGGGLHSRDKTVQAYDDVGRNFDAHEQASEDRQVELGEAKHATDTRVEDVARVKGDKYVLPILDGEPAKNVDVRSNDSGRKNSGHAVNAGNPESKDLEVLLRQKALENFRKFRGGLSVNASTSCDQKDASPESESCKDAGRLVQAKDTSSLDHQGSIQRESCTAQPRIRSVVNIPTVNDDGNSVISRQNESVSSTTAVDPITMSAADVQTTSNHLKIIEEPLDMVSSGKTLVPKDIQNKKASAEPRSCTTIGTELKVADGSTSGASSCVNVEGGNKPVEVDTTGSHFEQKTFSRMHDGEVVQVSYKVYIPKKSKAVARRQLQR